MQRLFSRWALVFVALFLLSTGNVYGQSTKRVTVYSTSFESIGSEISLVDGQGQGRAHWKPVEGGTVPENCSGSASEGYRNQFELDHSLYVAGTDPNCGSLRPQRPADIVSLAAMDLGVPSSEVDRYSNVKVTFLLRLPSIDDASGFTDFTADNLYVKHQSVDGSYVNASLQIQTRDGSYRSISNPINRNLQSDEQLWGASAQWARLTFTPPEEALDGELQFLYDATGDLGFEGAYIDAVRVEADRENPTPTIATNTGLTVDEGATKTITTSNLSASDPNDGASDLTFNLTESITLDNGTLLVNGTAASSFTQQDLENGAVAYRHDGSETTADSFTFTVADDGGATTAEEAFGIAVNAVNDPPNATADTYETQEDTDIDKTKYTGVLSNDSDPEGDDLSASVVTRPSKGELLVLNSSGSFTYSPNTNENGTDSFTYEVSDGNGGTDQATVTLEINPVNDAPTVTTNAGLSVTEGETTTITTSQLSASDVDDSAGALTFDVSSSPSNGTLLVNGASAGRFTQADLENGRVSYRHDGSNTTTDSFTFGLTDDDGDGPTGITVSISVSTTNDPPTLALDPTSRSIDENNSPPTPVSTITVNDDGSGSNELSLVAGDTGAFSINSSDELVLTEAADYETQSSYSVSVAVDDPAVGSTPDDRQDFTLSINDVSETTNQPPSIATNAGLSVDVGNTRTLTTSALSATDPDDGPSALTFSVTSGPDRGTLLVNGTSASTFTQADLETGAVAYRHTAGDATDDQFSFQVRDDGGKSTAEASFSITVNATNTAPAAPTGLVATGGDQQASLTWDANTESDLAGYHLYRSTASFTDTTRATRVSGSLLSGESYTDTGLTNGTTYAYRVVAVDDAGAQSGTSGEATATPSSGDATDNTAPSVATNAGLSVSVGETATLTTAQLSATDPDDAASALTFTVTNAPSQGALRVGGTAASTFTQADLESGRVAYAHTAEVTTDDAFSFRVSDDGGKSTAEASFSITVNATNTAPAAPTGLVAVGGDRQASLTWDSNSESDMSDGTYEVHRATSSGFSPTSETRVAFLPHTGGGEQYTDDGSGALPAPTNGTVYYYKVLAIDEAGNESEASNEDVALPSSGRESVFSRPKQIATTTKSTSPQSVDAADLDSDDDLDVLLVSSGNNTLSWFENNGEGQFSSQKIITSSASNVSSVHAADLDGDGDPDVITAASDDNRVAWYENQGDGQFSDQRVLDTNASSVSSLYAADLNGDGNQDILASTFFRLAWFTNQGDGTFSRKKTIGGRAESVYAADLNGNGTSNPLYASQNDDNVGWYTKDGSTFSEHILSTESAPNSVRAVDLDEDGDLDVLVASAFGYSLAWHENEGNGSFSDRRPLPGDGFLARTADVDQDGTPDVLSTSSKTVWHENEGDAALSSRKAIAPSTSYSLQAPDLDGDGDPDVLTVGSERVAWHENVRRSALPSPVTGVTATADSVAAQIEWNARTSASGYRVYRSTSPIDASQRPAALASVSALDGNTTTFVDSSVTAGVAGRTYHYRVTVVDSDSLESPLSPEATATLEDRTPPPPPPGLTATAQFEDVTLAWEAPDAPDVATYRIYRDTTAIDSAAGPSALTPLDSIGADTLTYQDTTGTPTTPYHYRVTAVDSAANESGLSADATATPTDGTPPPVPSGVTATPRDQQVTLTWDSTTTPDLAGYRLYRDTSSFADTSAATLVTPSLLPDTTYTDTSLTNGQTYRYRVAAVDTADNQSALSPAVSTTPRDRTAPTPPAALTARADGERVVLDWAPVDAADAARYRIYRNTAPLDSAAGPDALTPLDSTTADSSTFRDSTGVPGTQYHYRITAVDSVLNESGLSNEATATPVDATPPAAPTGLTATAGNEQVRLTWTANDEADLAGYRLYRAPASFQDTSGATPVVDTLLTTAAVTDTTLTNGRAYHYRVAAVDTAANQSALSSAVVATPQDDTPPSSPAALSLTATADSVALSWPAVDSPDAARYRIYRDTAPLDSAAGPAARSAYDSTQAGTTALVDTGVVADSTYHYRVTAVDTVNNESGFSPSARTPSFTADGAPLAGRTGPLAWGDVDGDGDLDLLAAGDTEDGQAGTVLFENQGDGSFAAASTSLPDVRDGALAWADFNNDGHLDIAVAGAVQGTPTTALYRNDGDGSFTAVEAGLTGVDRGALAWGDVDRDGTPDLLVTGRTADGTPTTLLYRNDGDGQFRRANADLPALKRSAAAWADVDADGDLDLALAGQTAGGTATAALYRNDGTGSFAAADAGLRGAFDADLDWGDYDADGDPDLLLLGRDGDGTHTTLYRNAGDGQFTAVGAGLPGLYAGSAQWGDLDADGDLDVLLSGADADFTPVTRIYRTDGEGTFVDPGIRVASVRQGAAAWADADGDRRLDLAVAGTNADGTPVTRVYRNDGGGQIAPNTPPTAPTALASTTTPNRDSVRLRWTAADDEQTAAAGLTYNLQVRSPNGARVVSPSARPADGTRHVVERGNVGPRTTLRLDSLREGTYDWSVQAVDGGRAGGPFSATGRFTIRLIPDPPARLTATSADAEVTLAWDRPADDVAWYRIYRDTAPIDSAAGPAEDVLIDSVATGTTRYTDTDVINGTAFYYRVTAVDTLNNESGYSRQQAATPSGTNTEPPAAPTGLTAATGGPLTFSWDANLESDLARYHVYRNTEPITSTPGALVPHDTVAAGTTAYTDTSAGVDSTYHYRLTAVDAGDNESGFSPELQQTRPADAALAFDGTDDHVAVPNASEINLRDRDHRTIEAWFKVRDKTIRSRKQVIWEEGGSTNGFNIYVHDGALYVGAWSEDTFWDGDWLRTTAIERGTWHHVALTFSARGRLRGYLDGRPFDSTPTSAQMASHSGAIAIGALRKDTKFHDGDVTADGPAHAFAGRIDEVRVWNASRSASALLDRLGGALTGTEDDLAGYWPLNTGYGTVALDASGNDLSGPVNGATWVPSDALNSVQTPPLALQATAAEQAIRLRWRAPLNTDVSEYRVYRDTAPIPAGPDASRPPVFARTASGDTTVVDTAVTAGTTYHYRVTAVDAASNESRLSDPVSAFPRSQHVRAAIDRSFGDASGPGDYRLVALPGTPNRPLSEAIDGTTGSEWRAYRETGSSFERYDDSDAFTFRKGRGFWLVSRQNWTVEDSLDAPTLQDSTTAIPLTNGWTIIANPFGEAVSWSALQAVNNGSLSALWPFGGAFSDTTRTFASAASGRAYYFYNDNARRDSLRVPHPSLSLAKEQARPATKTRRTTRLLSLSAAPANAEGPASTVRLGLASGGAADNGLVAPPGGLEPVSLRIEAAPSNTDDAQTDSTTARARPAAVRLAPDDAVPSTRPSSADNASKTAGPRLLMADRRAPTDGGVTVRLRLTSRTDGPVRLTARDLNAVAGREVALLHPAAGRTYDLRAEPTVTIRPDGQTTLRLALGSERYVDQKRQSVLPDEVRLTTYPSPIREQGILEYSLPDDATVQLQVYDVLGRRVATLARGPKAAGRHTARLSSGDLSSGVYFGRLTVGDQTRTRKIVIVR